MDLSLFNTTSLYEAATDLFSQLNIQLNSNTTGSLPAKEILKEHYRNTEIYDAIRNTYFIGIVDESIFREVGLFDERYSIKQALVQAERNYDGLMLFALELDKHPTRTEISDLTRSFNRISQKMPVGLLLKYENIDEAVISIAISERFKYKQNWRQGEKAGKVIILRDIHTKTTHAGHFRILKDLTKPAAVTNYAQLHTHWLEVLDVSILNKRFFQELANWYFWAMEKVSFPDDVEKVKELRNATNLIRLITRIIFIWFIKEKKLVPNNIFRKEYLTNIVVDFMKNNKSENFYHAILQNLFFGTLNQVIEERRFVKEGTYQENKSEYGVKNLFRYAEKFLISEEEVIKLFKEIPFLNGGLFDCLDKPDDNGRIIYVDGFSRNHQKQSHIPDYVFFTSDNEVDLNEVYGTKNKRYKVQGLINLLESYKFTVAENTPIEEEIALDPELLGKVFENLLASYNPETKTTARKQTGSFYTPREIVNYMVDESLIEYLKESCGKGKQDFESSLRELFSYSEDYNPFNEVETIQIIESLNNCKILDPACGSGAFPMGILHKMVHLLTKLDSGNKLWKELQKGKAVSETKVAYEINDHDERKRRLDEIDDVFENNTSDYGRKLYLIENCIYGIDIQPIAVQIAKLRFFISLIIDQDKQEHKVNFGIRSLPNLETKFVAANSLISLEKPELKTGDIFLNETYKEINALSNQLKEIRHKYFNAKLRTEKLRYQQKDKEIRKKISILLIKIGHTTINAHKIAAFDPYDQNHYADWFETEWMFGKDIKDSFDIVIGNPPFGAKFTPSEKQYFKDTYKHQDYQPESYLFFTEKSFDFLKEKGVLTFIIPNPWLTNLKLKRIRKFLTGNNLILNISHYHKSVFDAVVDTEIVIFKKGFNPNHRIKVFNHKGISGTQEIIHNQDIWKAKNGDVINIFTNDKIEDLVKKLKINSTVLSDIADVYAGVVPYEEGKGKPPQTRLMMKNKVYNSDTKIDGTYRKVLRGSDINKFENNWDGKRWIKYGKNLAAPRKEEIFNAPKIVIRQTGDSLIATYDEEKFITLKNTHVINSKAKTDLKYILGLLNSNVLNFYFRYLNPETGEALAEVKKENVEKLLIKSLIDQRPIIDAVEKILSLKKSNSNTDTTKLENDLNFMVYKIYNLTSDEIQIVEEMCCNR